MFRCRRGLRVGNRMTRRWCHLPRFRPGRDLYMHERFDVVSHRDGRSARMCPMYEYHGWCSLRWTAGEVDDDAQELRGLELVASFVAQLHWPNGFCTLTPFNGKYCVHLGGVHNTPQGVAGDLNWLFNLVAQELPGSYGLLYWRDSADPAPPGLGNWHVRLLARGSVHERFDPFLSPITHTSEDR